MSGIIGCGGIDIEMGFTCSREIGVGLQGSSILTAGCWGVVSSGFDAMMDCLILFSDSDGVVYGRVGSKEFLSGRDRYLSFTVKVVFPAAI